MIWLFDVNVLIAISDPNHIFHSAIHLWLMQTVNKTWASCPITENGMVRVLPQPSYRGGRRTPSEAIETLRMMKLARPWRHVFWPDELSITDESEIVAEAVSGPKQVTEVYLAAMAKQRGGCLVTFDNRVAWHAVAGGSVDLVRVPTV